MKFKVPENISALSAEELAAIVAKALEAFKPFNETDPKDLSDDDITEMETISNFLLSADEETTKREGDVQAREARISAAREAAARVGQPAADPNGDEGEEGEGEEEGQEEEAPEPATSERVPEPVTASAPVKRNVSRRVAPRTPAPDTGDEGRFSLVAAAGVRNVEMGRQFANFGEAQAVILDRLQALPTSAPEGTHVSNSALVLRSPNTRLSQANFQGRDSEMLMQASRESMLPKGNLIAAGGWGAPSERVMDFCPFEVPTGLINLPEVTITRGGVTYTKGPDFSTVLNSGTGFWDMTEAVAEAGTQLKTSLRPAIPPFVEKRLDAVGVMMEAGLLLRAGWPELVDQYAQMALAAHQLKVSAKVLDGIRAYTGAAIDLAGAGFGNALDALHILEMVANGERQRFALGENATLEVLLPVWARSVIRADLANRNGVDLITVTDQQINAFFTARNLRVQWLNLYQEIDVTTYGIASKYPDLLDVIMYPAGTYVKGVADVITLDTVYDSVNLKKNDYVHLFVEQGVMVTNPCGTGRRFTFPLTATGQTGAANLSIAFGGRTAP